MQRPVVRGPTAAARDQRYIEDPLAEELIRGHLHGGETEVYLEDGQMSYRQAGEPLTAGRRLSTNV